MALCSVCKEQAIYLRRYSGQSFCGECFVSYFEDKAVATVRKGKMLEKGEKIGIALSGGKDSLATLSILSNLAEKLDLKLHAIAVDEGIKGYREGTLQIAERFCRELGVPLHIESFKEHIGYELDEITKVGKLKPCSYCGVFRRRIMNVKAGELGISKLATGHNLDDEAQAVTMNYLRADIEKLRRMRSEASNPKLVRRIKPLSEMPEKEVALYTIIKGFEAPFTECPYANGAFRIDIRDFLNDLESKHPGTKYSVMRGYERILPGLAGVGEFETCKVCGEPTSAGTCKACELLQEIAGSMDRYK